MKKLFSKEYKSRTISFLIVIIAYIIIEILLKTGNITNMIKNMLVPITVFIVMTISLNLVVGFSGELSLGHAAFMSIGAFTGAIVATLLQNSISNGIIRLIIAIIVAAIISAIFGFLISIPVLKLKGDYLAIVTLAFCQIVKGLITNVYLGYDSKGLHFSFINNNIELEKTGVFLISGPVGTSGVKRLSNFTVGIVLVLIALVIVYNLIYSKYGRAITASRDNRIAATSVGVDIIKTKMLAFVISAALAGGAGALYGLNYSSIIASKFDFNQSIMILVYVVFGGLGNITGSIISTTILVLLPELLRFIDKFRMIIYSLSLIAIMLITNNKKLIEKLKLISNKLFKKKGDQNNA